MEKYKEKLDYLLELKKEKEPTSIEREEFCEAWGTLVAAEGYSDNADAYIYAGYTYRGADPLKKFISGSESPIEALKQVLKGKMYRQNCASTVPILFNLLALFINEKQPNIEIIALLISEIPGSLRNKEGVMLKNAYTPLRKYFLNVLTNENMPSIQVMLDNFLPQHAMNAFIRDMTQILSEMPEKNCSAKCKKNIDILKSWMQSANKPESLLIKNDVDINVQQAEELPEKIEPMTDVELSEQLESNIESENLSENTANEKSESSDDNMVDDNSNVNNIDKETEKADKSTTDEKSEVSDVNVADKISELENEISFINDKNEFQKNELEKLKNKNLALENELEQLKTEFHQQERLIENKEKNIRELEERIVFKDQAVFNLTKELTELKNQATILKTELADSKTVLAQTSQMNEALRRDRVKTNDEASKRLASKLRVEYRDFLDAVEIPMDTDLGENMREQLKNIFEILKKAGISLD